MAYQTGTATDVNDLLDQLRVFAVAQGWTQDNWSTVGTGKWLALHLGSLYFDYLSDLAAGTTSNPGPKISLYGATGFNGAATASTQTGTSLAALANGMPGPFTAYHFFLGSNFIHVVVEVSPGIFSHIACGELDKTNNTYTGGAYVSTTNHNYSAGSANQPYIGLHCYMFDSTTTTAPNFNYLRADIDSFTNKWWKFDYASQTGNLRAASYLTQPDSLVYDLWSRSPNAFNGLTIFIPVNVLVTRTAGGYSPLGPVKEFRVVNMRNLVPGDTITIGTDTWIVFPATQKTATWDNAGSTVPSSGDIGYAYKKVV